MTDMEDRAMMRLLENLERLYQLPAPNQDVD